MLKGTKLWKNDDDLRIRESCNSGVSDSDHEILKVMNVPKTGAISTLRSHSGQWTRPTIKTSRMVLAWGRLRGYLEVKQTRNHPNRRGSWVARITDESLKNITPWEMGNFNTYSSIQLDFVDSNHCGNLFISFRIWGDVDPFRRNERVSIFVSWKNIIYGFGLSDGL